MDPDVTPGATPALWLPSALPTVVILDAAPPDFDGPTSAQIERCARILSDHARADGRHCVVDLAGTRHHLWLRCLVPDQPLAFTVPVGTAAALRQLACHRFQQHLDLDRAIKAGAARDDSDFAPSPFQRHRLNLSLALLDAMQTSRPPPTLYELARTIVFPAMAFGPGSEWKGSSERRQTQRLVKEARAIMMGGYRTLLQGSGLRGDKSGRAQ